MGAAPPYRDENNMGSESAHPLQVLRQHGTDALRTGVWMCVCHTARMTGELMNTTRTFENAGADFFLLDSPGVLLLYGTSNG